MAPMAARRLEASLVERCLTRRRLDHSAWYRGHCRPLRSSRSRASSADRREARDRLPEPARLPARRGVRCAATKTAAFSTALHVTAKHESPWSFHNDQVTVVPYPPPANPPTNLSPRTDRTPACDVITLSASSVIWAKKTPRWVTSCPTPRSNPSTGVHRDVCPRA